LQVEIIFHLAELSHPGHREIDLTDLEQIDPERLKRVSQIFRLTNVKAVKSKEDRGFGIAVSEMKMTNFSSFFEYNYLNKNLLSGN
jgi:hypothetical protein